MEWTLVAVLTGLFVVAVRWLLARITAAGGTSEHDAVATADQILAEAQAFRGSRSLDDQPWDGHNRLAPPTQDGGVLGG